MDDDWLALLTWVPGQPLTGQDRAEQNLIGTTLARVHRALAGHTVEAAQRFHWVDPDADYLSLRPGYGQPLRQRSPRSTLPILMACRGACCTPTLRPAHSG